MPSTRWIAPLFLAFVVIGSTSSLLEMAPPIDGLTSEEVRDTFNEVHSGHSHEAIDLLSPRGTPVHSVASGTIRKLFLSKPGGNTIYAFDEMGVYCYYYAHLDRYAEGLREGMRVKRGQVIGFVGSSGNASGGAPHLHFAVFELGPDKQWYKGKPINPYAALLSAVSRAH